MSPHEPALRLGLAHRAWRLLPAGTRRAALARVANAIAPRPDPIPPTHATTVAVAGEFGRASGLGEGARLMRAALAAHAVAVESLASGLVAAAESAELDDKPPRRTPSPGAILVLHENPPTLPLSLARLGRKALRGRRVIGYWAWELPVAPPAWRGAFRLVHEIWTPSEFVTAAIAPLAPSACRVRTVGHPLAAAPFEPARLDRDAFGLPDDAVVVLVSFSLASGFARKNPLGAIAAFRAAFGDRPDRILLLKVGKPGHAPADLARLREAVGAAPNIRLETRTFPRADSLALTAACDIVLSLHRSEGFGLVPAEAMLLARPVISTDWSATAEFLDANCACPVRCRLVPAADDRGVYGGIPGAVWAEPDIAAAAAALVALADDGALRSRLGAAARTRARARFTAEPLLDALRDAGLDRAVAR